MASTIFMAHSGWRWIVLVMLIFMMVKMIVGWLGNQSWTNLDDRLLKATRYVIYIQVVLGVILLIMMGQFTNMRVIGEHVIVALLGVGGIEFGAARAKKADGSKNKFKFASIGLIISLVLILVAIGGSTEWTFM